jgi:parallel beta-helix repeat protein
LADGTASFNAFGFGIVAEEGSSISGCTANSNELAGIQVSDRCIVTGNICDGNGSLASPGRGESAGMLATGTGNRIVSNCSASAEVAHRVPGWPGSAGCVTHLAARKNRRFRVPLLCQQWITGQ